MLIGITSVQVFNYLSAPILSACRLAGILPDHRPPLWHLSLNFQDTMHTAHWDSVTCLVFRLVSDGARPDREVSDRMQNGKEAAQLAVNGRQ